MKQKTDWELYLLMKNYKGKNLLTSHEVLNIFKYSKNTNIRTTKASIFIQRMTYRHPAQYWKLRNDHVAVLYEDLPDIIRKRLGLSARINMKHKSQYFNFIDPNDKIRYLVNEEIIPFWKLKKYGGYII